MATGKLKIATCQFAVSRDIEHNGESIISFIKQSVRRKADIIHFPECALSGYAGVDHENLNTMDWTLLREYTEIIMALAEKRKKWIVLGSTHPLTAPHKPHNCLYLIGPSGELISRYDKRFCMKRDLEHYTPGDHLVSFSINGIKCALLICFDLRFPELYRELKKQKVECIFQSFYNARQDGPSVHTDIMRQTMQCRAASNYFWVSMSNASGRYQPYPSCFIQPDGKIVQQLKTNSPGMMINTVDKSKIFYDPMEGYRDMAMRGQLSNGPVSISDPRSRDTTRL